MAAATLVQRRINPLLVVVLIAGLLLILNGISHANARHKEAEIIRDATRRKACLTTEAYVSPIQGKILVLCQLPGKTDAWGGIIIRFFENGLALLDNSKGQIRFLDDSNEAYEITCYLETRAEWNKDIKRDGYVLLMTYVDIEARFWNWFWRNL